MLEKSEGVAVLAPSVVHYTTLLQDFSSSSLQCFVSQASGSLAARVNFFHADERRSNTAAGDSMIYIPLSLHRFRSAERVGSALTKES